MDESEDFIIPPNEYRQMVRNGQPANRNKDQVPVVKLFLPGTGCAWLLSAVEPSDGDLAFGLCDLGQGFPELGPVSLIELTEAKNRMGLSVERDAHFHPEYTLSVYARAARFGQRITEDPDELRRAAEIGQQKRDFPPEAFTPS